MNNLYSKEFNRSICRTIFRSTAILFNFNSFWTAYYASHAMTQCIFYFHCFCSLTFRFFFSFFFYVKYISSSVFCFFVFFVSVRYCFFSPSAVQKYQIKRQQWKWNENKYNLFLNGWRNGCMLAHKICTRTKNILFPSNHLFFAFIVVYWMKCRTKVIETKKNKKKRITNHQMVRICKRQETKKWNQSSKF